MKSFPPGNQRQRNLFLAFSSVVDFVHDLGVKMLSADFLQIICMCISSAGIWVVGHHIAKLRESRWYVWQLT